MDVLLNTFNGTVVLVRDGKIALGVEVAKGLEVDVIDERMLCQKRRL